MRKGKIKMEIRRAEEKDIEGLNRLLLQVCLIHHRGRPDLFRYGAKKYTDEQLKELILNNQRPILVAVDSMQEVLGYAFCIFQQYKEDNILTDKKTLYIDDLCVDQEMRGQSLGQKLYQYVLDIARESGCYNVTLNVWACNPAAVKFYEKCGMAVQKIGMEQVL